MIQQMLAIWSLVPLPFSKSTLNIWKFSVHILLKPGLENFQHYFASMWDECNCAVVCAKNVQSILRLSLGLEWKLAFPRPVATALLSKFSGILTSEASGIWLQNFHMTGETNSWRAQSNLVHTKRQEKGAVSPQEIEPDLPVRVQKSPAELWVDSSLLRGQEHWIQQCRRQSFWRSSPLTSLPLP